MSIAKRAVNNIFWLFISQVCARVLTFLGTLYLARTLGVAGFGLYSLALAVAMYMWAVADMGVSGYGTREIARDTGKAKELLNTLNSLRLVVAIGSFLLLLGVLLILNIPDKTRWTFLAGGLYVVAYALYPGWVLRGVEKMEYLALGNAVVGISFLGSIYFLVKSPADTAAATLYRSLAFLLGSLVTLIILKRKVGIGFSFEFSPSKWWGHIKESWYFAVNGGLVIVSKFIPLLFLGVWASAEEVGLFSAPHRLVILLFSGVLLVHGASYPIFSSLYCSRDKFRNIQRSFYKLMLYLGLPVGVMGMLLGKDILGLLYGRSYLEASGIFKVMVWNIPLVLLRLAYSVPLQSAGFQKYTMFAAGGGAIVTSLLCLLLIPNYGGYGAALAMLGGAGVDLVVVGVMFAVKFYRSNPFDFYFLRVVVASIAVGIVVSKINFPVLLKFLTGLGVYGILSLLFGLVSRESILTFYQVALPSRFQLKKGV